MILLLRLFFAVRSLAFSSRGLSTAVKFAFGARRTIWKGAKFYWRHRRTINRTARWAYRSYKKGRRFKYFARAAAQEGLSWAAQKYINRRR